MKFLSIMVLGNTRTVGFYNAQYEQVFEMPKKKGKRAIAIKAPVNDTIEPGKNEVLKVKPKRPLINWFAGPHSGFAPFIK